MLSHVTLKSSDTIKNTQVKMFVILKEIALEKSDRSILNLWYKSYILDYPNRVMHVKGILVNGSRVMGAGWFHPCLNNWNLGSVAKISSDTFSKQFGG